MTIMTFSVLLTSRDKKEAGEGTIVYFVAAVTCYIRNELFHG